MNSLKRFLMRTLLIREATGKDTEILEILFQRTRQTTFKSSLPQNFKICVKY